VHKTLILKFLLPSPVALKDSLCLRGLRASGKISAIEKISYCEEIYVLLEIERDFNAIILRAHARRAR
jgi:hypothetical protein